MGSSRFRAVLHTAGTLAESPVWLGESRTLCWIDMVEGTMNQLSADGGVVRTYVAPYIGALVPTRSGDLVAVTTNSLLLVEGSSVTPIATVITDDRLRLNDASCDALGRLWVGSTAKDGEPGAGALHVWDPVLGSGVVVGGLSQPNGIGWSPDQSRMYLADTAASRIYVIDGWERTSNVTPRVLLELDGHRPDGLCVDAEGCLWVALWDGAEVRRYSPTGELLEALTTPVTRPTSCVLTSSGSLFVTTASHGLTAQEASEQPFAGYVLQADVRAAPATVGRLNL